MKMSLISKRHTKAFTSILFLYLVFFNINLRSGTSIAQTMPPGQISSAAVDEVLRMRIAPHVFQMPRAYAPETTSWSGIRDVESFGFLARMPGTRPAVGPNGEGRLPVNRLGQPMPHTVDRELVAVTVQPGGRFPRPAIQFSNAFAFLTRNPTFSTENTMLRVESTIPHLGLIYFQSTYEASIRDGYEFMMSCYNPTEFLSRPAPPFPSCRTDLLIREHNIHLFIVSPLERRADMADYAREIVRLVHEWKR